MTEHRIPVTYQCWGCGSEVVKYEPQREPVLSKIVWNLCKDCQRKEGNRKGTARVILLDRLQKAKWWVIGTWATYSIATQVAYLLIQSSVRTYDWFLRDPNHFLEKGITFVPPPSPLSVWIFNWVRCEDLYWQTGLLAAAGIVVLLLAIMFLNE